MGNLWFIQAMAYCTENEGAMATCNNMHKSYTYKWERQEPGTFVTSIYIYIYISSKIDNSNV